MLRNEIRRRPVNKIDTDVRLLSALCSRQYTAATWQYR
jgi:hypothetical protein